MTSKYAEAARRYSERTQFSGFGDKTLKFIGLSKKKPKTYIQLLSEELMPVPMHNYIEVQGKNGTTRRMSFVCRSFIDQPCYICDNHIDQNDTPRKRMIGLAIEYEREGKSYRPIYEDITVSSEAGEKIAEKYPDLRPEIDSDRYIFKDMPRVGVLDGNRSIDDDLALFMTETGSVNDCIFLIARQGEGLNTTYSAQRIADSPIDMEDTDSEETQATLAAIEMAMSVDDYIDTYIAQERYDSAFGLKGDEGEDRQNDDRRSSRRSDDDEDERPARRASRRRDDDDDDGDDEDVDIDQMFSKSFRRGRRDS